MFVRQLIGRQAGEIVEMPYHAGTSCIAMGTAGSVTDEEVAAAGLAPAPGPTQASAEGLPPGYRVTQTDGVYDLFVGDDADGVALNEIPLRNMVEARSVAESHRRKVEDAAAADLARLRERDATPIPDGWRDLAAPEMKALGAKFADGIVNKADAVAAIELEIERRKALPAG